MSERIDVFISSTSRDLPDHRKQAMDACLRMGMFPIMMEHLPASDADAIEASLKMVDDAEIYLGIFAWRYGYIPADRDISITEMEYNRAVERRIPRLIFVMHDDHPVKGSDVEKGASATKLEVLKERLLTEQVVNFFTSPDELRGQIIHSLVPHRVPDPGSLHSRYASEILLPPEPYIAHPYTLLQTKDLIGRQKELDMLTQWATQSDAAVFNFVVAIGGMGKSALTWKWFNDIAPDVMPDLAGRMWWSFYESDARFENFIIRALAYVSRRPREEIEVLLPSDREAQLLAILDKEPYLLVWDGFERTMLAYARMDAARMTDDDLDEKTANLVSSEDLPAGAVQSFAGKHQLRKSADPRIGTFLRKLLRVKKSRILVSTRLYPAELQSETGQALPRSNNYFLRGLEDEDAFALWQAFGVSGSVDTLMPMFHSFENYPLLIRALAGEVARFRGAPGDFDKWRETNPDFSPFDLPVVQVKSHVLTFALKGLTNQEQQVLSTVAAFRMPVSYDILVSLLVSEDGAYSSEQELDAAVSNLEDRGLMGWDRRANRYDLHPIVRGVTWTMLDSHHKQRVHETLRGYFETLPQTRSYDVKTLEDLAPSIELFNSLIYLERYDEAYVIWRERIEYPLFYELANIGQCIELLEMFFPNGLDKFPLLSTPRNQSMILNMLALCYSVNGRPGNAAPIYTLSIKVDTSQGKVYGSTRLNNRAIALYRIGQLYEAEFSARTALKVAIARGERFDTTYSLLVLGTTLSILGKVQSSKQTLAVFSSIASLEPSEALAQLALWQKHEDALVRARAHASNALQRAQRGNNEGEVIAAMRLNGYVELAEGKLLAAQERLSSALSRARKANHVEEELLLHIALAETARQVNERLSARDWLNELWEPIERGPYSLFHADALNVLAQIERDDGNIDAAINAATKAYQLAWCDGPPYAYHWGLEAAKKHLDELGAPYPNMPPFDPSKYEPMPDVGIDPLEHEPSPEDEVTASDKTNPILQSLANLIISFRKPK